MNATDLKSYTAQQVASLVDTDLHAVRDEGHRRQDVAGKKIERLHKQLAAAHREMDDGENILIAAFGKMQRVEQGVL